MVNRVSSENIASLFGVHVSGNTLFAETTAGYCENLKKDRNIGQQNKYIVNVKVGC